MTELRPNPFSAQTVDEILNTCNKSPLFKKIKLPKQPLHDALAVACLEYLASHNAVEMRLRAWQGMKNVERASNHLDDVEYWWRRIPPDTKNEIVKFACRPGISAETVGHHLTFATELLRHFIEHYGREGGRPKRSKARDGEQQVDIESLELFLEVILKRYWIPHVQHRLGFSYDAGRQIGDDVPDRPKDPALLFAYEAAKHLSSAIKLRHCATAMANLIKPRPSKSKGQTTPE